MSTLADNRRAGLTFVLAAALVVGGVAGLLVWEFFARVVAVELAGGPLSPIGLVEAVLGKFGIWEALALSGSERRAVAESVHYATGLVIYPLGYLAIVRPIARASPFPLSGWLLVGLVYGLALTVFAIYVLAHLVAGFPPFLGWLGALERAASGAAPLSTAVTHIGFASLLGHVAYGVALAGAVRLTTGR